MTTTKYTGQHDLIEITDGKQKVTVSFFDLERQLDKLEIALPAPCGDCEGAGEVVLDERGIALCGVCNGSRVRPTTKAA